MRPSELEDRVRREVLRSGLFGTSSPTRITVQRVLNWGGFVNWSFVASDGGSTFQIKLADNPTSVAALRRWQALSWVLFARYQAPRVHDWIEVLEARCEGLILEWIDGATPLRVTGEVLDQAVTLVRALHRDTALQLQLGSLGDDTRSCLEVYAGTYHDRFVEDVRGIRADVPPFLPPETLEWMSGEASRLQRLVTDMAAFAEPASAPTHGDLSLNNLLVDRGQQLRIIDWDDLRLGDPMMDWAMLLGPSRMDLKTSIPDDVGLHDASVAERERLLIYARAALLDWVIDPLADWVEATRDPAHQTQVRAENEYVHKEALRLYRSLYP